LEQKALETLRAYDKSEVSLDKALEVVLEYDRLYGDKRDHRKAYERTLTDKPWQNCGCSICKAIGIEVVIFRGNNRNRRRGFHNVKTFYEQWQNVCNHQEQSEQLETENREDLPQQLVLHEVCW